MKADTLLWLPFLLQTSDALFPTGAYAHSLGFEEIVRLGGVHDEASLREFLLTQVVPAQREQELPYLRFAFDAAMRGEVAELCQIDGEISAWKLARETREASAQLGARRLKALGIILRGSAAKGRAVPASEAFVQFAEAVARGEARGHHVVVCGLQAAVGEVPLEAALVAFFYQSLSAICAAAPKLIRIGQDGCQRALRAGCATAAATIADSRGVARASAGWWGPLLEIASMRHERAGERLFIS